MNKCKQDRLSQQARQIQTLFRDFKKMLSKCRQLALQLRVQLPNESLYSNIERTTLMKVTLLDLPGLINLKNSIAKTTSELLEQEREFNYKKERQEINPNRAQSQGIKKEQVISTQARLPTDRPSQSLDSMRSSRASDSMRQSKSIEIPIYKARVETAEGKMDRISKYIASLKKNIKINADAAGSKWRVRDYLLTQPTYLHARTQLERYLMRQQEIDHVVSKAVRSKIEQFFAQSDRVTSDEHFYYVRVKRPNKSTQKIVNVDTQPPKSEYEIAANNNQADPSKLITQASPVRQLAEQDFQELKLEIQRKNQSYVNMFVKMNEVVDSGRQRLNEIREKRKQAFEQEEDIWGEL